MSVLLPDDELIISLKKTIDSLVIENQQLTIMIDNKLNVDTLPSPDLAARVKELEGLLLRACDVLLDFDVRRDLSDEITAALAKGE